MKDKESYNVKTNQYFKFIRYDLIEFVSFGENRVLEIGCGEGLTGSTLKELGKAKEVVGIELDRTAAEKAKRRIDKVIPANVEHLELSFSEGYFNYLIMGDVIEHMVDPWRVLSVLRRFLSPEGYLVASIPNVGHWRILKDLVLLDKWDYQEAGLLDKGHLRFFTKRSIVRMLMESGYEVNSILSKTYAGRRKKPIHAFVPHTLRRFVTRQYLVKARKSRKD